MGRRLAAAFILTTSVAAGAACSTANPSPPVLGVNPPEPISSNDQAVPPPEPRPTNAQGVPLDLRADEVTRDEQGQCFYVADVDCPPPEEATCNPPMPVQVDCPPDEK